MKAIVCTAYGSPDTLQLKEVDRPSPKDDEVLVKVHAASLNAADLETLRGVFIVRMTPRFKPMYKILGSDMAGRVEAVGTNMTEFQPGDEVWGDLSFPHGLGALPEYVCVSESALAPKPASMTFEEAATYPQAAIVALQSLRDKGDIQPGQKVLINGAGGGMGTFAIQLAKYLGAEVTGVDSTGKLDMLRSIGADRVIDYTQEDYARSEQRYDLILDVAAYRSRFDYRRAMNPGGIFMIVGGSLATFLQVAFLGALSSKFGNKRIDLNAWERNKREDLAFLAELFEAGKVVPVIDSRYPLLEVPEALRYLEQETHLGKIVITVADNNKAQEFWDRFVAKKRDPIVVSDCTPSSPTLFRAWQSIQRGAFRNSVAQAGLTFVVFAHTILSGRESGCAVRASHRFAGERLRRVSA